MNTEPEKNNSENVELSETNELEEAEIEDEADSGTERVMSSKTLVGEIYEWVEIFVITITAIFVMFTFFARIAYVDGPSMNNTLHDKETLVVSKLFYTPERNDIVVFQSPDSGIPGGIVKRIIATEGQVVDIDFATWTVTVDGEVLDEAYVNREDTTMRAYDVEFPYTVPENTVFVMGDNRNHSNDSRGSQIGPVDTRFIFGKVLFRITPLSRFGSVK